MYQSFFFSQPQMTSNNQES